MHNLRITLNLAAHRAAAKTYTRTLKMYEDFDAEVAIWANFENIVLFETRLDTACRRKRIESLNSNFNQLRDFHTIRKQYFIRDSQLEWGRDMVCVCGCGCVCVYVLLETLNSRHSVLSGVEKWCLPYSDFHRLRDSHTIQNQRFIGDSTRDRVAWRHRIHLFRFH